MYSSRVGRSAIAQASTLSDGARIYVLVAVTPDGDLEDLGRLADGVLRDVISVLEPATHVKWRASRGEPHRLESNDSRQASDFLREALLRLVESPADMILVITDAALVSRADEIVPGLASPEARVAVLSTRKLLTAPFGEPVRSTTDESVRWNAGTLATHLVGHLLGLSHEDEGVMAPFSFDPARRQIPNFGRRSQDRVAEAVVRFPEREVSSRGPWGKFRIHLTAAARHRRNVVGPALISWAPLLPLSLTGITTAAVTPTFVILFTDEFWWAGLHLNAWHVWSAALVAVLVATFLVPLSQRLFFPHREKRVVTEHVALVNTAILFSMFLMSLGLFVIVTLLVLLIEFWLFPQQFIVEWFSDRGFDVGPIDHLHIAMFVSALGTLTGALAGGFHGREIIHQPSLFLKEP